MTHNTNNSVDDGNQSYALQVRFTLREDKVRDIFKLKSLMLKLQSDEVKLWSRYLRQLQIKYKVKLLLKVGDEQGSLLSRKNN